jgi:hypothetical protein
MHSDLDRQSANGRRPSGLSGIGEEAKKQEGDTRHRYNGDERTERPPWSLAGLLGSSNEEHAKHGQEDQGEADCG